MGERRTEADASEQQQRQCIPVLTIHLLVGCQVDRRWVSATEGIGARIAMV